MLNFILFFFAAILSFYIPGRVLLGEQKGLSSFGLTVLALVIGIALWAWQGYIFGYLGIRWMSYLYLGIFLFLFIRQKYYQIIIPHSKKSYKHIDWIAFFIGLIGVLSQSIVYLRNGQKTSEGLFLMNNNLVDHIWHAAVVNEIIHRFPPHEPGFYGIQLVNYHYWFNLVTAEMIRVFHLSFFPTQFMGMYLLGSVLFACLVYLLAKAIYPSKMFIYLSFFFLFFAGDIANWVTLILKNSFFYSVDSLVTEATRFMDSPARGFSVIIALAAVYLFVISKNKWSKRNIFLVGLLFGSLMGFKVYTGIPFLLGLGCLGIYALLKKQFATIFVVLVAGILACIQFLPTNHTSGGLVLAFAEVPRSFIAQPSLGLSFVDMRWRIFLEHSNYLRITEYIILMSGFYFLVQFGIKLLGFYPLKKARKLLGFDLLILFYGILFTSIILGLFFYQKVGGANIFEFFLTSLIILGFLAALNLTVLFEKFNKWIVVFITVFIIVLSIPKWIFAVQFYINDSFFTGFHGVTQKEIEAFNFVKNTTEKDALIFIVNHDKFQEYASLGSVLMDRPLFLSGRGVSGNVSEEIANRRQDKEIVQTSLDPQAIHEVLVDNKIQYLFFYGKPDLQADIDTIGVKQVFSNDAATVLEVLEEYEKNY